MAEGDTIHRYAERLGAALGGREIELAEAPDPRSPIHHRAAELRGRTLERAEARGKHLLASFSGGLALHSHLGINGSWRIRGDGLRPRGRPWLLLASGPSFAGQFGGKLLRVVSESRLRNDPTLMQLGPDPLRPEFDVEEAAQRLMRAGAGRGGRRRIARPDDRRRDRERDQDRGLVSHPDQSVARGLRAGTAGGATSDPRERAGDAGVVRKWSPPSQHLRHRGASVPTLRDPHQLAWPGRREPDRILVSHLPGGIALPRGRGRHCPRWDLFRKET